MTPYMTRVAVESMIEGRNVLSWQIAMFIRAKKFPGLEEVLRKKPVDVAVKMKNMLMQHNAERKK